ncbi:unnamed protein product [Ceutorhynchus assimilis]|uniref:Uncharacterized protein n=1 Tax=Ceutorhynchus assimilis TaxID=467358 RepID=A0A9N9MR65_9CUCU|nr:unnamed protein product [Ceutorhynchus assimilis]
MEPGTSKSPHHQKRMGPAPFASFEDLSDEVRSRMESPSEKEINVIRLPGITEQDVLTPSPDPDSRRSHHSGVSLIGAPSPVPYKMKLANITPRIDISRASSSSHHDSRDSTPEREIFESTEPNVKLGLGFKEDDALELRLSTEELDFHDEATKTPHHYKHRSASPEFDELYINNSNRKDSQCSDVILLSISGRTSRVSSIGSHCSQGSGQSRLSNASHISITSGRSAYSQCSSPHKTLLETSFCGPKGSQSNLNLDNQEINEKIVLARKSNVGEAVLMEGMKANKPKVKITAASKEPKEERPKLPRKIISKSGVEYIYIPLKGPLPVDDSSSESRSAKHKKPSSAPPIVSSRTHEPKYIRIKLKPDHCYDDNEPSTPSSSRPPTSLNLTLNKEACSKKHARSLTNSPKLMRKDAAQGNASPSPSVPRRNSFVTLFRTGPDSPSTSSLKQKKKNTLTKKAISSTESVDSKGSKHKSSVLSLFKAKQHQKSNGMAPPVKSVKIHKPEKPPSTETIIRIPLHSPTYYENKSLLQELQASSQDSQVTVVEVAPKPSPVEVASKPSPVEAQATKTPINQVTVVELNPSPTPNQITVVEVTSETEKCQKLDLDVIDTSLAHAEVESTETTTNRLLNSDSLLLETSSCHHEDHNSSESEKDSDVGEFHRKSTETERKAIVLQQDSFEDELPYVPTTLPQERSAAVPILPVKQRCVLDIKTCPIERPRSTTPIQHSSLENYFDGFSHNSNGQAEKLKISLPRADTKAKPLKEDSPPPPLPPKGIQKKSWINFEEVPERRKPPKRIQTIPSRGQIDIPGGLIKDNVVYTYVNPEECKCECHEHKDTTIVVTETNNKPIVQEDEVPLLNRTGETSSTVTR